MDYHSTRGNKKINFVEALSSGLAENGGLFVPDYLPDLSYLCEHHYKNFQQFSTELLQPFLKGSELYTLTDEIVSKALNFPIVHKKISSKITVLELFHGPTLSFKDFGARFLANSLSKQNKKLCLLVATSGDTGSAVGSSFYGVENVDVFVLFPKGKITPRQQAQICCFDKNVQAIEVDGVFDDCQALVKQAFADDWFNTHLTLSTANSINIARLLPQMTYYAFTAINHFQQTQKKLNFIIPAGNLGNATACIYAKQLQLPIGNITLSTNNNKTITDYLNSGKYSPRASVVTLANAMDVGAPSNFERLTHLFKTHKDFTDNIQAVKVSDVEISQAIINCYQQYGYLICPHTATAFYVAHLNQEDNQCIVSTAAPSKFEEVIEPIIKQQLPIPEQLNALLTRKQSFASIKPTLAALKEVICLSKKT